MAQGVGDDDVALFKTVTKPAYGRQSVVTGPDQGISPRGETRPENLVVTCVERHGNRFFTVVPGTCGAFERRNRHDLDFAVETEPFDE